MSLWKEVSSKTIAGVLTTIIVAVGGGFAWWIWGNLQAIVASAWSAVSVATSWLLGWSHVPRWWHAILVVVCGVAVFTSIRRAVHNRRGPRRQDVTQLKFNGLVWRWDWLGNNFGSPRAFCPQCDRLIGYKEPEMFSDDCTDFLCSGCGFRHGLRGNMRAIKSDLAVELEHIFRSDRWQQHLPQNAQPATKSIRKQVDRQRSLKRT